MSGGLQASNKGLQQNTDELEELLAQLISNSPVSDSPVNTEIEYVQDADVSDPEFVDGSQGSPKRILVGESLQSGDEAREILFEYRDSEYPTQPTSISENNVTVS